MITQETINFSNQIANIAGEISKKYFHQKINSQKKADNSPVTIADQEIEKILRTKIQKKFPNHGIIGEEFGESNTNAEFVWVIDPIDGTKAFMAGIPTFTNLIALCYKQQPILGVINQPILSQRWVGYLENTFLNNQKISTRKCQNPREAEVACTSLAYFTKEKLTFLQKIQNNTKFGDRHLYGGDAYLFAMLASGKIDIIVESGLKKHDIMALVPIVKGAGGAILNWDQSEIKLNSTGDIIAFGDQNLISIINR